MAKMELGSNTPKITGVYEPIVNEWGLWVDFNVIYEFMSIFNCKEGFICFLG